MVRDNGIWAITAYFNPAGYRRRRENFRHFRDRLGIPLLAVELGFNGFELGANDAEILIRTSIGDVMWQKERLLNLGLAALPATCGQVAWIDSDIIFERRDWWEDASAALDKAPVVQLFSHLNLMPRDALPGDLRPEAAEARLEALSRAVRSGMSPRQCLSATRTASAHAYSASPAWAIRRDVLETFGFYDACVVGGGDSALVAAFHGLFDLVVDRHRMNEARAEHYLAWARPVADAVAGNVAVIEGDAFHLWHGRLDDRRYAQRHADFSRFGFDPNHDIAVSDSGAWRWNSAKPAMHAYVASYFRSRREDG